MARYKGTCERCGKPIRYGKRMKLALMRERKDGFFSTAGFSRYYCEGCANEVVGKVDAHE